MTEQEEAEENIQDDWISSGADYSPKAEYKQAINAMEAMKSCREFRATEMKQGFWNTKLDKQGNAIRIWQPDQRKMFINSVIAFENLLSAECQADSIYNEFRYGEKSIQKKIDELFNKYAYTIFEYDSKTTGWKKTDTKFIPQIDEELMMPSLQNSNVLSNVRGGWNYKINMYYEELVLLYDKILKELRNVIFRIKDFKKKQVFG